MYDDELTIVAMDIGTATTKVGIAGDEKPELFFPTIFSKNSNNFIFGQKAFEENKETLHRPLTRGVINNWEDYEKILENSFENLKIEPSSVGFVFSQHPFTSKKQKTKINEIMFETFNCRGFHAEDGSNLISYASGRNGTLVVDSGEGVTYSQACHSGTTIDKTLNVSNFGGMDISEYLGKILSVEKTPSCLKLIKENVCKITTNIDDLSCDNLETKTYKLPDGNEIKMDSEFFAAELLFQPDLNDLHSLSIQQLIANSVQSINDIQTRKLILKNIILAGGNCSFDGINERVTLELSKFFPNHNIRCVKVSKEEKEIMNWIGASIVGSLTTYQEIIKKSRHLYSEIGSLNI
jgi:actin-related protein